MAITAKWRQHIEAWQRSGLSQAEYCAAQQLNVRTFTARLSDYRKFPKLDSTALIPVQIQPVTAEAIVFTHAQGHRLELPASMPANWLNGIESASKVRSYQELMVHMFGKLAAAMFFWNFLRVST